MKGKKRNVARSQDVGKDRLIRKMKEVTCKEKNTETEQGRLGLEQVGQKGRKVGMKSK